MKTWAITLRAFLFLVGITGAVGILSFLSATTSWSIQTIASLSTSSLVAISYFYFALFFNKAIPKRKRLLELAVILHFLHQLLVLINITPQQNDINPLVPLVIGVSIFAIWIYWIEKVSAWVSREKDTKVT